MATVTRLLAALLLLWSVTGNAARLNMLTYINPPYVDWAENRELQGLSIEIFRLLQQDSQLELSLAVLPLKRAYQTTTLHNNHCVFAIERAQARESDFVWISPMHISRYAIYLREDDVQRLFSLQDLQDQTIGSYQSSGLAEYLASFGYRLELSRTNKSSGKMLERKRVDIWASDILSAAHLKDQLQLKVKDSGYHFYSAQRSIACNKDTPPELLKRLELSLYRLYQNGQIPALIERYEQRYQVSLDL